MTAAARRIHLGSTAPISLIDNVPDDAFTKGKILHEIKDLSPITTNTVARVGAMSVCAAADQG
jgi:hypothetical protein